MFTDGFFNADPHPGNLLVRNEPGIGPLPVLLDFGLCKRLANPNPNPNPNPNANPNPNPNPNLLLRGGGELATEEEELAALRGHRDHLV